MVKAIPMEDWLRGCIYHDGRHGYVTLPTDKVHQIANYIQRTRRSNTDGLIDLEVVEADRKTEPKICDTCRYYNSNIPCGSTPSACKEADKFAEEFVCGLKKLKPKDEPQTYVINPQEPTNDDKCFDCDDFFTCDGQCDEVEDEPQPERIE